MKRILSALLAVLILAGTTVSAAADADGITDITKESTDIAAEIMAEKFPNVTDLRWHYSHNQNKEMFGWVAWKPLESKYNDLYMYSIKVYRDDTEIFLTNIGSGTQNGYAGTNLANHGIFTQSGKYKFAVSAKPYNLFGDYTQGDFAESEIYEYILPEQKAETVKKVTVNSDYSKITFPTNSANSYSIIMEYTVPGSSERIRKNIGTEYKNGKSEIKVKFDEDIKEVIRNYDAQEIYIGVQAASPDLLQYQNSEIVYAPVYKVPVDHFGQKVAELVEKYNISSNHNDRINELISELDAYIAEKKITIDDMRSSFEIRKNVQDNFGKFYSCYCNFNRIFDEVKDESKNDYFAANGMNLGRTEEGGIVRYNNVNVNLLSFSALSNDTENATFTYTVLSEPKGNAVPSKLIYDKAFGVHIDFEGVVNPEKLKYPAWIKMPLPLDMEPNAYNVSMLRLNDDGTFTPMECSPGFSSSSCNNYEEIGIVSFLVDGAGDYYFVTHIEDSPYDFDYDFKLTVDDIVFFIDTVIEFALNGWLGETYQNPYDINSDNSFDMQDLNDLMKLIRDTK